MALPELVAAGAIVSAGALVAALVAALLLLLPHPASRVPSTSALDKITEAFFICDDLQISLKYIY
ncbi:hypothetical protein D3C74_437800 [compost metagenome]